MKARKRKIIFPVVVNDDEREYIARKSSALRITGAGLCRMRIFGRYWREELRRLQIDQNNIPIEQLDGRYAPRHILGGNGDLPAEASPTGGPAS